MNDHTACGLGGRQYGTSQEIETLQGQGHRGGQSAAFRAFGSEPQHHTQSHAVQPIAALHTEYSLMNRRLGPFWVAIILNGSIRCRSSKRRPTWAALSHNCRHNQPQIQGLIAGRNQASYELFSMPDFRKSSLHLSFHSTHPALPG